MSKASRKSGIIIPPVEFTASTTIFNFLDFIFSTLTNFKFITDFIWAVIESEFLMILPKL